MSHLLHPRLRWLTLGLVLGALPASAAVESGVEFADRAIVERAGGQPAARLELCSTALLRYRLVFKGFAAAYYRDDCADADPAAAAAERTAAGAERTAAGAERAAAGGERAEAGAERAASPEQAPQRLELAYFWPIDGDRFGPAAEEVLRRTLDDRALAALEPRLRRLHAAYRSVRPGDRYALTYLPGRGTELALNGQRLALIAGEDFARAYFGIWLGEQPMDTRLRDELLGRATER